jgi:GNAT superfamily N-acetyltransferase
MADAAFLTAIEVRPARSRDAEAMLPLLSDHAAFEEGVATTSAEALGAALNGSEPGFRAWVAERDGELVGYATVTYDYATWTGRRFPHLECLFVRDKYRDRGIGARLFNAVRDHAAAIGADEMKWQTPVWNEAGQRFYLREGGAMRPQMRFTLALSRTAAASISSEEMNHAV